MHDVIIIGGGVIGLSLAFKLAGQGVDVALLDQSQPGQEASWAGAGILPPGNPEYAQLPEARLRAASHVLWPKLSEQLREETGIDNGYRPCGGIELRLNGTADELDDEIEAWREEGVQVESLSGERVFACEPELSQQTTAAYRLPEMSQVRNPRHLKALLAGCAKHDATLLPGTPVAAFDRSREKIVAVHTANGRIAAGQFVVTSGAWTSRLLAEVGCRANIRPLRGQMVLLNAQPLPIRHVIHHGPRYIVPRPDGRVLIGSTEEAVGFDKRNTAGGVGGLTEFAFNLVPALRHTTFERAWAGLRPQSPDGLPYLGRVPAIENLFVAAGHFRSGLQMSPITAVLLSELLLGREPSLPLDPYAVDRKASVGWAVPANATVT